MYTTLRRRRGATLGAVFLSASLVLTACGDNDSDSDGADDAAGETRTVEADNGTIEVPVDPQRVVTIGNASLPYVDLGGEPVGVTEAHPDVVAQLSEEQRATLDAAEVLGAWGGDIDVEKIASLEPDLILAQMPDADFAELEDELQEIAPTVFFGFTSNEYINATSVFAQATNRADVFADQEAQFEDRISEIQVAHSEVIENSQFVAVERYSSSEAGQFHVIQDLGCYDIAKNDIGLNMPDVENGVENYSFEQINELSQYDAIFYPVDNQGEVTTPFADVAESNSWQALPAVTSGHALGVMPCVHNGAYGFILQYLDSLDDALTTLETQG